MFGKILNGAKSLFNKIANDHGDIFNKISIGARKFDNSIARVGKFLIPSVSQFSPVAGKFIQGFVDGTHDIRNNLEKAIHTDINDIRTSNYI